MAFRYSGVNWEGRSWQCVPAIVTLGTQIELEREPGFYPTDGTVASRAHDIASPTSDHSPDGDGDVLAIDWGGPAEFLDEAAEAIRLSRDHRVKYVIHGGRMFSSYPRGGIPPFTWRPYGGANAHETHVHVSVLETYQDDLEDWSIRLEDEVALTEAEIKVLQDITKSLETVGSSGFFAEEAVRLIRRERDLPLHDASEEVGAVDEVARTGVAANAVEIKHVKETLREV